MAAKPFSQANSFMKRNFTRLLIISFGLETFTLSYTLYSFLHHKQSDLKKSIEKLDNTVGKEKSVEELGKEMKRMQDMLVNNTSMVLALARVLEGRVVVVVGGNGNGNGDSKTGAIASSSGLQAGLGGVPATARGWSVGRK
ncbi:hypothetical protein DFH27DRAFT_648733 [Peziza echinospora]|nr:hypothetical protein DFH27DRAFT_648733 [Peziza echinospora]